MVSKNINIIPCGTYQPMEFIKNFKNNKATQHVLKDTEYTDRLINIKDSKDIGKLVCIHTTITHIRSLSPEGLWIETNMASL